jgi:rare lipoprotein A (peptidoglycan hydrolase)
VAERGSETAATMHKTIALLALSGAAWLAGGAALAAPERIDPATDAPAPDLSGRARTGIASFYADFFAGRKMAD